MSTVDVLIPAYRRQTGLAVVLTSLLSQTLTDFDVVISDQTEEDSPLHSVEVQTLIRALRWRGHRVSLSGSGSRHRRYIQGPMQNR